MNYKVTYSEQFPTTDLTGFSKMEARCLHTLEPLKVGDEVVVVYLGVVKAAKENANNDVLPLCIPLETPLIVKRTAFEAFSERLLDSMAEPQIVAEAVTGSIPPSPPSSSPPSSPAAM